MRYKKFLPSEDEVNNNSTATAIFESATELFMERGYKSVTLRDIASHAGVTLGLIPYHFSSRENLAISVSQKLMDNLYKIVYDTDLSGYSSAEKLYIYTILSWQYMDNSLEYSRFFYELLQTTGAAMAPSNFFVKMTWQVIHEYGLDITPKQNEIYLIAMKGAERLLVLKRYYNELDITREEIMNILLSNYFYNIGLGDEVIAKIIYRSQEFVNNQNKKYK